MDILIKNFIADQINSLFETINASIVNATQQEKLEIFLVINDKIGQYASRIASPQSNPTLVPFIQDATIRIPERHESNTSTTYTNVSILSDMHHDELISCDDDDNDNDYDDDNDDQIIPTQQILQRENKEILYPVSITNINRLLSLLEDKSPINGINECIEIFNSNFSNLIHINSVNDTLYNNINRKDIISIIFTGLHLFSDGTVQKEQIMIILNILNDWNNKNKE